MILVTGGTGLVGSHLLLHLLGEGHSVRATHRESSDLNRVRKIFSFYVNHADELFQKIDWVPADLADIPALESAFENVTHVYHCAALISFDPRDFRELRKVNELGTKNIVNQCIAHKIEKLCYVSSIAALGDPVDQSAISEEDEWNDNDPNPYALAKHLAEMEVWRGSQEGLKVVIVNPGIVLGPGFWNTGSGVLFKTGAKGHKFYPPGGSGFVTVGDVVKIMVELMESDVVNERFITVDQNLSYAEILTTIAREFGKRTPKSELKTWQLELLWRLDWLWCSLSGKKRSLTKKGARSLGQRRYYSNIKIRRRLNFEFELMPGSIYYTCNRFKEEYPEKFS